MSIATAITNAQGKVANAYTAVSGKGGTLPVTQNLSNLPTAINSIPSGGGGGTGIPREVSNSGVYQIPTSNFTFSLPNTATDIGGYAMDNAFYYCSGLTSADLSSLTTLSGTYAMYYAFYYCSNLTSVDLSSLTTISGSGAMYNAFRNTGLTSVDLSSLTTISGGSSMSSAFAYCTSLTSVDLSSLTTVSGDSAMSSAFAYCTSLTSVDLSSLTTVSSYNAMSHAFDDCSNLTNISFPKLEIIGVNSNSLTNYSHFSYTFYNCNNLTSISFPELTEIYCTGTGSTQGTFANNNKVQKMYFPKLSTITYGTGASTSYQNACKNIFWGCSALVELHFASANQSAIEASPGYSTAWGRGAGNVTIYFDL